MYLSKPFYAFIYEDASGEFIGWDHEGPMTSNTRKDLIQRYGDEVAIYNRQYKGLPGKARIAKFKLNRLTGKKNKK